MNPIETAAAIEALHTATAIYTSGHVVDDLLDQIGWPDADGDLVDPSCGDGQFLVGALRRLDIDPANPVAARRVCGWEIHPEAAGAAVDAIATHLIGRGVPPERARALAGSLVTNEDFLLSPPTRHYRFVVGNPPYLRFGHLPEMFKRAYGHAVPTHARADMCHAFLDRCAALATPDGAIALVTSDRWLGNASASSLRHEMGRHVGIEHVGRIDVATSFHRPKNRVAGSPPRIHPVSVLLRPSLRHQAPLGRAPVSPDGHDDARDGTALADVATVRMAPWLGPRGIFVVGRERAAELTAEGVHGADLVPAIDTDDIHPHTDALSAPTRMAIRTTRGCEPTGAVAAHLRREIGRMPPRGIMKRWWMPPETITLPLDRPALLVPRIARRIRTIRIAPGVLPINHNLYVVAQNGEGPDLDAIEAHLLSATTQEWVARNAPRLESGYLDIRAGLIRRIPWTRP